MVAFEEGDDPEAESARLQGIASASCFALLLTRCALARPSCGREVRHALALRKRIVLLPECASHRGGAVRLRTPPAVRCGAEGGCEAPAVMGPDGSLWPVYCRHHAEEAAAAAGGDMHELGIQTDCRWPAVSYALRPEALEAGALEAEPLALELGHTLLGAAAASVPWVAEPEAFREASLAQLSAALGLRAAAEGGTGAALATAMAALSCGAAAPALAPPQLWHICILAQEDAAAAAEAVKAALEGAFRGATVAVLTPFAVQRLGQQAASEAAAQSACCLLLLTAGALAHASPLLQPAQAALGSGAKMLLAYETDCDNGGACGLDDFAEEAAAAADAGAADVRSLFGPSGPPALPCRRSGPWPPSPSPRCLPPRCSPAVEPRHRPRSTRPSRARRTTRVRARTRSSRPSFPPRGTASPRAS